MSECDSTAPVSEDVPAVEVPETSLQTIAIIPLPEDLQFDTVTVEHENDALTDVPQESIDRTPNFSGMRMSYTVEHKLNVLDWYHAHGENKKQTAKHFGVDRKRIRDWVKFEQQLRLVPPSSMQRRKKNAVCSPHYKVLDQAILEWCKEQVLQGQTITNQALRTKALELAPQLGYGDTFKASTNWALAWRRRNKAVFTRGNDPPADATAMNDGKDSQQCNTDPEVVDEVPEGSSTTRPSTFTVPAGSSTAHPSTSAVPDGSSTTDPSTLIVPDGSSKTRPSTVTALLDALGQEVSATNRDSAQTINQREHEQWIALIQQTVDSLANEFQTKINQIKLLLEHLNTSIQQCSDACTSATKDQPPPSKPANRSGKRPLTSGSTKAVVAKRARKT